MPLDMATEPPPPEGFAPEAMEEEFRALREDLRCYAVLASKLFYSANAVRIYFIKLTAARSSNNPNAISKQRNYTDASVLLLDVPLFVDLHPVIPRAIFRVLLLPHIFEADCACGTSRGARQPGSSK